MAGNPLERSATMPVVNELMRSIDVALDDATQVDLILLRSTLADELEREHQQEELVLSRTVRALREDKLVMIKLMMALPVDVTRSLVRHTLGFDFLQTSGRPFT